MTASLPIDSTTTAAHLVGQLLARTADPAHHETLLRGALRRLQAGLQSLEEQRLGYVEQGWEAAYAAQINSKTALVSEVTRVLAERFGC